MFFLAVMVIALTLSCPVVAAKDGKLSKKPSGYKQSKCFHINCHTHVLVDQTTAI